MTKVLRIRDENGLGVDYAQYEEVIHPVRTDIPRRLRTIKDFKYEKGDVFICSYPKSGSHWMAAMMHLLLHAKSREDVMTGTMPLVPFIDLGSTRKIAIQPRLRIMTSSLQCRRLPAQHLRNNGKIILLLRNPKDTAVSMFYHLKGQDVVRNQQSWDHFLKCFATGQVAFGSFFDYVTSWTEVITENIHTNILLVYYEDLVQNCVQELERIQGFLGTDRDKDTLGLIAKRCSFVNLQQAITSGKMPVVIRDIAGDSILLRKGKVGDWRNHFTAVQNEVFNAVCQEQLEHSMFKFRYDTDKLKHKL